MVATPGQAAHASPGASASVSPSISDDSDVSSQSSDVSVWDSQVLRKHAECLELEELAAISVDPILLPTLNDLLLEVYTLLRPKPLEYEQRNTLVHVFKEMTSKIFGSSNGLPAVEAFGSFTMDLFTHHSDLDISINFSDNIDDRYTRKKKISALRKFAKVLYSHQRDGICYGVLPILSARVPILKFIDRGTGIECDISIENKDGMTRSMIFKFISSLDERFNILSYLVKSWALLHGLNSPRELTMSSMSIISLVAFHLQCIFEHWLLRYMAKRIGTAFDTSLLSLSEQIEFKSSKRAVQTREPPILPPFSAFLNDGLDCAHVERNIRLFKGFGSRNKESVAELFVSLISKLLSAESLWEHGLCASNLEASWISKTWKKGVGNLSVEDFLDRSQNFARSVGKVQMRKICKCLRDCSLNLLDFMRGKIHISKLKTLLFGHLNPDGLVRKPRLRHGKGKRKLNLSLESRYLFEKRAKHSPHHVKPHSHSNIRNATGLPTPTTGNPMPRILYQRSIQSNNQIVHVPWLRIIPSRFGYGLTVALPVDPHFGKGILGAPPTPGNLNSSDNGIQKLQQRPLLPTPNQRAVGNLRLA